MTTTPLPPPAYPESAKHGASKNGKHVKVVIRPALYTAEQMQACAASARADLEAENKRLREALSLTFMHLVEHVERWDDELLACKKMVKAVMENKA